MAYESIPSTGSQLDRAIVACLKSRWVGSPPQILPANSYDTREAHNITVISHSSTPEQPPAYDVELFEVQITISFPLSEDASAETAEEKRALMDAEIGVLKGVLMQSSVKHVGFDVSAGLITTDGRALATAVDATEAAADFATNNADMAEFTCLTLRYTGCRRGRPDVESNSWVEQYNFRARACPYIVA